MEQIKEIVHKSKCKKVNHKLVDSFMTKSELIDYLRKMTCPELIKLEAELQKEEDAKYQ